VSAKLPQTEKVEAHPIARRVQVAFVAQTPAHVDRFWQAGEWQPVATGGKWDALENRSNRPIRNRSQPTATVPERMVRRGRRFESVRGL
jgi:hypothetical protein